MSENIITTAVENENTQEITAKYFLDQIEKIREDNKHVYDAIAGLSVMQTGAGDFGAAEQAQALASVVQSRETTNQQMIDFYTRAYEECLANDEARRDKKIQQVQQIWLSYLDHVASTIADEESVWQTKSNVESQINLLVMDILEDKIK